MNTPNIGRHGMRTFKFGFPWHVLCRGLLLCQHDAVNAEKRHHKNRLTGFTGLEAKKLQFPPTNLYFIHVHGLFCHAEFDNDPSAGSPTETLLRLLLPLNDKVQWNSRDVAGSEPPTSPRS